MYIPEKDRTFQYSNVMKKLILAAALLLSVAGARNPFPKFMDPIMECPPNCDDGNVISSVR
jgi:hypothetical protein